uniref:MGC53707 protein n=1 Tax=Xenopus laevis TaxID=8355 RepID=Q7ZWP2_XENLA|nr:MGC53707 protein [Xenopus laevis]
MGATCHACIGGTNVQNEMLGHLTLLGRQDECSTC